MTQVSQLASKRVRPVGVAVVALFLVADSVMATSQILFDTPLLTRTQTLLDISEFLPGLVLALSLVRLVVAIGLWLGYRWAWVGAMLVVGIGLVLSFVMYWVGDSGYARMAIVVVMAFYLNQGAVRDYFEGSADEDIARDPAS